MGGTIELVVKLKLVGATVDEKPLIGVHSTQFKLGACRVSNEGSHLVLILAEKDAIIALAHGL